MQTLPYDRAAAVRYARRWAFARNPAYYAFDGVGGDCTNFVSQCLFAGGGVMNFTPLYGWYYRTAEDRTPSWTGVRFLCDFLLQNDGPGPYGEETSLRGLQAGDVVQLGDAAGNFYHSCLVSGFAFGVPLLAAHSADAFLRPLTSYDFARLRFLHILGVRTEA